MVSVCKHDPSMVWVVLGQDSRWHSMYTLTGGSQYLFDYDEP